MVEALSSNVGGFVFGATPPRPCGLTFTALYSPPMQLVSALVLAACLFTSVGFVFRVVVDVIRHIRTSSPTTDRTAMLVISCILWGIYIHIL